MTQVHKEDKSFLPCTLNIPLYCNCLVWICLFKKKVCNTTYISYVKVVVRVESFYICIRVLSIPPVLPQLLKKGSLQFKDTNSGDLPCQSDGKKKGNLVGSKGVY